MKHHTPATLANHHEHIKYLLGQDKRNIAKIEALEAKLNRLEKQIMRIDGDAA